MTQLSEAAAGPVPQVPPAAVTPFQVRCHLHPRRPEPGCRECSTAIDVNFQGHCKNTCGTVNCWWCSNPGWALQRVPMASWER
jgi:hypothetical protein